MPQVSRFYFVQIRFEENQTEKLLQLLAIRNYLDFCCQVILARRQTHYILGISNNKSGNSCADNTRANLLGITKELKKLNKKLDNIARKLKLIKTENEKLKSNCDDTKI